MLRRFGAKGNALVVCELYMARSRVWRRDAVPLSTPSHQVLDTTVSGALDPAFPVCAVYTHEDIWVWRDDPAKEDDRWVRVRRMARDYENMTTPLPRVRL